MVAWKYGPAEDIITSQFHLAKRLQMLPACPARKATHCPELRWTTSAETMQEYMATSPLTCRQPVPGPMSRVCKTDARIILHAA